MGDKHFYTRKEVAALIGVSTLTVIRWEQAGRLQPTRFGSGSVRYSKAEVEKFIAQASAPVETTS